MANIRTLSRSFSGGELTPEMFGRIDDTKYQTGLALCRNFITLPHGPATNRAGFAYVNTVKTSAKRTRLIPFTYSSTQTMVLEFGEGYLRFHTQGATLQTGSVSDWSALTNYTVGALVSRSGVNYYCIAANIAQLPPNSTYWYALTGTTYEIPTPYQEADLFDIHYVQSADVLTLVHPNYAPRELRRLGATNWQLSTISFASSLSAPSGVSVTPTGFQTSATGTSGQTTITVDSTAGVYIGQTVTGGGIGTNATVTKIVFSTGVVTLSVANSGGVNGIINFFGPTTYRYVVTAVGTTGIDESLQSSSVSCTNYLSSANTKNVIAWSAVSGAQRYRVYKEFSGIFCYIGQTDDLNFTDDNITPDVGTTVPISNNPFGSAGNYPGAVSYFEQRRCFAGTTNLPQTLWMTRTGTESNMSYSLPTQDDDAISFRVAAREANTIRHIIPLTSLVLLTSSAEWRVTSVNSDAITPTTVSVKPQSYVGASNVQPVVINNQMIYAAARGGHVRELAYSWQAQGFITGDLSLRAPHLFDTFTLVDMAYAKAPTPIVWAISSNGKLLGLTYVPEQQVGAWHQHDTDGTFESCCVVAEGDEDVLYVVTKRTVNGSSVRYIERQRSRLFTNQADAFFVDAGATFNGANTSATTVTVSGGTTWGPADTLTVTASAALFAYPGQTDVNDAIVFTDADGTAYRLTILATSSTTVATARVDKTLPAGYRNTATTAYAFARDSISGLTWLEGKTVSILADGAVHPQRTVTSGTITLDRAASKVQVGLPITADIQTLPWYAQVDAAFGQGRAKNVNKVWLRVFRSSGIFAGPSASLLTEAKQRTTEPYGTPPALKSDEISLLIDPQWNQGGQVFVRQADPLPLTLVSMTMEVALGA